MIDELALREKAARGSRYRELLAGGDVTDALDAIEKQYATAMLDCHDRDQRDNLWRGVQVVRKIKAHFGQLASGGTLASHQIAELSRLR